MIGSPVTTGIASDLIDAMLHRSRGEVLAVTDGGESDYVRDGHLSRKSARRLAAAGLISNVHGMPPDRLAHMCDWEGGASEFVEWWCETGLKGLDARAERRTASGEWCDQLEPEPDDELEAPASMTAPAALNVADVPGSVVAYLERLIHGPKAEYATVYVLARLTGGKLPADPGHEWAGKARHKIDKLIRWEVKK